MAEWNERAFFFVNGDLSHPVLDPLFVALSWFGGWAIALPVLVLLAHADWRDFLRRQLPVLLLGTLLVFAATKSAKPYFDVDRPVRHFASALQAGEVKLRSPAPGNLPSKDSFPSGHSSFAFFFMMHLSLERRRHAAWALPLAALVAISRVYVGAHFPLDCLAGAALGAGVAVAGWHTLGRVAPRAVAS